MLRCSICLVGDWLCSLAMFVEMLVMCRWLCMYDWSQILESESMYVDQTHSIVSLPPEHHQLTSSPRCFRPPGPGRLRPGPPQHHGPSRSTTQTYATGEREANPDLPHDQTTIHHHYALPTKIPPKSNPTKKPVTTRATEDN